MRPFGGLRRVSGPICHGGTPPPPAADFWLREQGPHIHVLWLHVPLLLLGSVKHFEFLSLQIRPRNICLSADSGGGRSDED